MIEAYDWVAYWVGRAVCRTFRVHARGCRGRRDHSPYVGIWL